MKLGKYWIATLSLKARNDGRNGFTRQNSSGISGGFTIVELLVVIVVIGVLAAITFVTYGAIAQKATVASLQSDLSNAAQQLKVFQATYDTFPTTIDCSQADSATNKCLKSSNGTTYQYTFDNTTSSFCITATNGSTKYKVDNGSAPASGRCSITNLTRNPTGDASVALLHGMGNAPSTVSVDTATKYTGSGSIRVTGDGGNGMAWYVDTVPLGGQFRWSAYVYSSTSVQIYGYGETFSSDGTYQGMVGSPTATISANVWTYFTWTGTSKQASGKDMWLGFLFAGGSGQTIWIDDIMTTTGVNAYSYADGNSSGWIWKGTANLSSSTGPMP